jgi:hypothetical protein
MELLLVPVIDAGHVDRSRADASEPVGEQHGEGDCAQGEP